MNVPTFLLSLLLLASPPSAGSQPTPEVPVVDWATLFSRVSTTGAEFAPSVRALDGKRVRIRGYALREPLPAGGLFLTRTPEGRLHPDDEETLPWDAVVVLWKAGIDLPAVPSRPTVEGTLRLGRRRVGSETVILALEEAVPVLPAAEPVPSR